MPGDDLGKIIRVALKGEAGGVGDLDGETERPSGRIRVTAPSGPNSTIPAALSRAR
jgi:hypothetical protein